MHTGGVEDTEVFEVQSATGGTFQIMFSYNDTVGDSYSVEVEDGFFEVSKTVDFSFIEDVGVYFCNRDGEIASEAECYIYTQRFFDLFFGKRRSELPNIFPYIQIRCDAEHYSEMKQLVWSFRRDSGEEQ